jgi:hypothetical protein
MSEYSDTRSRIHPVEGLTYLNQSTTSSSWLMRNGEPSWKARRDVNPSTRQNSERFAFSPANTLRSTHCSGFLRPFLTWYTEPLYPPNATAECICWSSPFVPRRRARRRGRTDWCGCQNLVLSPPYSPDYTDGCVIQLLDGQSTAICWETPCDILVQRGFVHRSLDS